MVRPLKQGLEYFPLDVDMDTDDKVAMIEALHGIEGFGVVVKLLSKIYKEGYFYGWTDREQLLFSKRINVNINSVSAIVNDCIKEGLFNKPMYETYQILTSKGIQKRYLEAVKRRKQVIFTEEYFLIDDVESIVGSNKIDVFIQKSSGERVNVNNNSGSVGLNGNKSTQRKEKQNRTEQSKPKQQVVAVNPFNFYQENFGVLSPYIAEDIEYWIKDLSEELVVESMKIALQQNKNWKYATGILKDWLKHNIKTLDDVQAYNKQYESGKEKRTGFAKKGFESPIKYDNNVMDLEDY